MNKQKLIGGFVVAVVVITLIYSFSGQKAIQDEHYVREILKERAEKEDYFSNDPLSPFIEANIPFNGLQYYDPDPVYKIKARLIPSEQPKMVKVPTSDGLEKTYIEFGHAEFEMHGQTNRLLILELAGPGPFKGTLFLAFGDATSADETYGGGRYLEVTAKKTDKQITLDFNQTYNPYCAYVDDYSCPLPPPGNLLEVPIRAGEKNYIKK